MLEIFNRKNAEDAINDEKQRAENRLLKRADMDSKKDSGEKEEKSNRLSEIKKKPDRMNVEKGEVESCTLAVQEGKEESLEVPNKYSSNFSFTGNKSSDLVNCVISAIHSWKKHYYSAIPDEVLMDQLITLFEQLKKINK